MNPVQPVLVPDFCSSNMSRLVSSFAFNFSLRRYTLGYNEDDEEEVAVNFKDGKVRRRRKTRREWGKIPDAMVRNLAT